MNLSKRVKIAVTVPEQNADELRQAIGEAGAGKIGEYAFCSISYKVVGRFMPGPGANPAEGDVGKTNSVNEEMIEVVCDRGLLMAVIEAIKKVHPYEEVAIDIYPLEEAPVEQGMRAVQV